MSGGIQSLLNLLPFLRLTCGLSGLVQRVLNFSQLLGDFVLPVAGELIRAILQIGICSAFRASGNFQRFTGTFQTQSGLVRPQLVGSSPELIGRLRILLAGIVGKVLQLLLQRSGVVREILLLWRKLPSLLLRTRSRRQRPDLVGLLALLGSQLLEVLLGLRDALLHVLRRSLSTVVLVQQAIGVSDRFRCLLLRLLLLLGIAALFRGSHVVGSFPKSTGSLGGLRIILLARHLFELTCHFLEIPAELLDVPLVILRILLLALLPLNLGLLATSQFSEFIFQLLLLL